MSDELREKVVQAMLKEGAAGFRMEDRWDRMADAAIALVRAEQAGRIAQLEAMLREVMEQCPEHVPYGLKNQIRAALGEDRT